jgi:hypothetical protein
MLTLLGCHDLRWLHHKVISVTILFRLLLIRTEPHVIMHDSFSSCLANATISITLLWLSVITIFKMPNV